MSGRGPVTRTLRIHTAHRWGGGEAEGVCRYHLLHLNGARLQDLCRAHEVPGRLFEAGKRRACSHASSVFL